MKKRIGIVTFHGSHNYGSVLQTYALCQTLSKMGLEPVVVNFVHPAGVLMYEFVLWSRKRTLRSNIYNLLFRGLLRDGAKRRNNFHEFVQNEIPLTKRYFERKEITEHFDYLVCGSDQIWNPDAVDSRDMIYFLDFGDKDTIRFSYAASSGSREFLQEEKGKIKELLSRMKGIGVREEFMKDYLNEEYNLNSIVNPDPTILLSASEWDNIELPVLNLPNRYLLVYSLHNPKETVEFAKDISQHLDLPVVHINTLDNRGKNICKDADYSLFDISPYQYLWLFHHAEFVVSNSFHGNMFSVIFRKPFVCFEGEQGDTRIVTLHNKLGLGNSRILSSARDFTIDLKILDYSSRENIIEEFIKSGLDYISQCIS